MTASTARPEDLITRVGKVKPCRLVQLENHVDQRGQLSVVESGWTIGFSIERVYYLHHNRPGAVRGGHAHRRLEQLMIPAHGSFTVTLDDGVNRVDHHLADSSIGLYVGPMVWRELHDFSPEDVCLVLASRHYEHSDYMHDYDAFVRMSRGAS